MSPRFESILANKDRYIGKELIQSGYGLPQKSFKLSEIRIIAGDTLVLECGNGGSFTVPESETISCVEDNGFSIGVKNLGNLSLKEQL